MSSTYLLFGSNIGNRVSNIQHAIQLCVAEGIEMLQISHFYETEAWGNEDEPSYYNLCAKCTTNCNAENLLTILKSIEKKLGRVEREKWGSREIDIDILYFFDQVLELPNLIIPHPFLIKRNFALHALHELAPEKKHPVLDLNTKQLIALSTDEQAVEKLKFKPKL